MIYFNLKSMKEKKRHIEHSVYPTIGNRVGSFINSLTVRRRSLNIEMNVKVVFYTNQALFLEETNYSSWRIRMKGYMKSRGSSVWESIVVGPIFSKRKSKIATQRESKKNNSIASKEILDGISGSDKERIGQCTSAKELWLKLKNPYQGKI